ncbi:PDZ domain-containing protein [Novipirellula rosea]|uniref:PDZ domain-containing protein n=1 Tax=Novipirellula rosea TaxID=1031540 RepID=A0ABP8N8Y9_9BACT
MNYLQLSHLTVAALFAVSVLCSVAGCGEGNVGGPVTIVNGSPPEHGMLGVTFGEPPQALIIADVLLDGPAFQAGVEAGDEILSINNEKVESADDVLAIVRSTKPGDEVVLRVRRSTGDVEMQVTMGDFATIVALTRLND